MNSIIGYGTKISFLVFIKVTGQQDSVFNNISIQQSILNQRMMNETIYKSGDEENYEDDDEENEEEEEEKDDKRGKKNGKYKIMQQQMHSSFNISFKKNSTRKTYSISPSSGSSLASEKVIALEHEEEPIQRATIRKKMKSNDESTQEPIGTEDDFFRRSREKTVQQIYLFEKHDTNLSLRFSSKEELLPIRRKEIRKELIILVDDTPFNLKVIEKFINQIDPNITIKKAFNGAQALETVEKCNASDEKIKMMFLDCNMPVMNGYEASEKLKKRMKTESLEFFPIIAVTAYSGALEEERCKQSGMDDFLAKPVSFEAFRETYFKWLKFLEKSYY